VIGRMSTIAAPLIAEKPDPLPMMTCIVVTTIAMILSCSLS